MFKAPFSFEGRIRRTEYCLSILIFYALLIGIVFTLSGHGESGTRVALFYIFLIPGIWFMIVQGAKRCHDRGNSGWYQLIPFYRLWMIFAEGDYGVNEYGDNPKGDGNDESEPESLEKE